MKSFDAAGTGTARPILSISAVARMLGVPVATIRTWEDRYGLVVPDRNASGHRLYSRDQVEQLRFVHARMAEGPERGRRSPPARRVARPAGQSRPGHRSRPPPAAGRAARPACRLRWPSCWLSVTRTPPNCRSTSSRPRDSRSRWRSTGRRPCGALTVRPPAVAVIELLISGGTGLDLCRSFKRHGVPVIAASVLRSRDQALEAGADAFLAKPLDPAQLASAIRDLLGLSPRLRPEQEAAS